MLVVFDVPYLDVYTCSNSKKEHKKKISVDVGFGNDDTCADACVMFDSSNCKVNIQGRTIVFSTCHFKNSSYSCCQVVLLPPPQETKTSCCDYCSLGSCVNAQCEA